MTTPLEKKLKAQIARHGALSVHDYMAACLYDETHGYYRIRDPLGADGDFITAPEISQLFGEMIAVWILDCYQKLGAPPRLTLCETGPGRGTLMSDILRVLSAHSAAPQDINIIMIETSEALIIKQKNLLKSKYCKIKWINSLSGFEAEDHPVIFIGNEFLDALPVQQFEYQDGQWFERLVTYKNDMWSFALSPKAEKGGAIPRGLFPPKDGDIFECAPAQTEILKSIAAILNKGGGAALFIDYGSGQPLYADTLQALHHHQEVDIFHRPGECDLTAHVRFGDLNDLVMQNGQIVYGLRPQGSFLNALGLQERARMLTETATEGQKQTIKNAVNRLTAIDQMGDLFKAWAFGPDPALTPAGF